MPLEYIMERIISKQYSHMYMNILQLGLIELYFSHRFL